MGRKTTVNLFYDVISPYAWVNFEAWLRYQEVWPIDLKLRPFYLPGVFQTSGNIPPISLPNKDLYLAKDVERLNKYWGMNMVWTKEFREMTLAHSSVYAMRTLAAVQKLEPEKLVPASRAFWDRVWREGKPIFSPDNIEEVVSSIDLNDAKKIIDFSRSKEGKELIVKNTQEAVETKCFGTPWMVIQMPDNSVETFFGSDRMHLVAQTLGFPYLGPLKELSDVKI